MVVIHKRGIRDLVTSKESVSILVGPNGSGKSSLLLDLAKHSRKVRDVTIVCNTPHDRFAGLRNVKRVSAGRSNQSPPQIVKRAVADSLRETGSTYYQISAILDHCGYEARFGFEIEFAKKSKIMPDEWHAAILDYIHRNRSTQSLNQPDEGHVVEMAVSFLHRYERGEKIWMDAGGSAYEFSRTREFAYVLELETVLRRLGVIRRIHVLLKRKEGGVEIEMEHASSGQLALISTMLFLITNVGDQPLIIIDEPENSLHPSWQRDYIEKILVAMNFRNAAVVIATHAPLVVTGGLASYPGLVSIIEVRHGYPKPLNLDATRILPNSIEAVLWQAFDVITPANHFVSERIVDEISLFEKGEISKYQVLSLVERMERESFDERQKSFFRAVRDLVSKIEAKLAEGPVDDG
ncbi:MULTISPECIES: AAA family ATPase [unclassified Pseudophaeobacter]|jgi:predicted ATPase/AraC-like DNA-binding protein|uniref:AAA family ATPase n=1 Tax=unclassified Pseudophaeobacter TaxID=2637024 RepID=UPI000EFC5256|nr:AAA family ATPase [Pseudophaeobacter sp. EL27]